MLSPIICIELVTWNDITIIFLGILEQLRSLHNRWMLFWPGLSDASTCIALGSTF